MSSLQCKRDPYTTFSRTLLFALPLMATVFILTVFRDISTGVDYQSYLDNTIALRGANFISMWSLPYILAEPLLLIIMKFCAFFSIGKTTALIPFLALTTATVLYIYHRSYKAYSRMPWLSWLMLFCLGSYFTIFNTTSQFFVCALSFGAAYFIYAGNFKKYLLITLLLILIHKTAVIMIPLYFLLRFWPTKKYFAAYWVLIGLLTGVFLIFYQPIVQFAAQILFPEYASRLDILPSVSWQILPRPVLLLAGTLLLWRYVHTNQMEDRVWVNAMIYTVIFSILALQLGVLQRFTYFLLPFSTVLIPNLISRIPERSLRKTYTWGLVVICFAYVIGTNLLATTGYRFLWQ